ncbi:hypothetical protein [Bradyrhizobium cenepequi]|uniref:hypothetical protein n=1 Tax=Bradyrhizobium cenepequi TaxID=2821403 RepID=UPI001CE39DDD|nr:hypothetical protein [Bradyrhizobium cenepequi]MCA6106605.1 hypothetical protein [Bradyrhizobium cenepequi]
MAECEGPREVTQGGCEWAAAHAGNGVTLEINGERIHIEALHNCDSLSCIKITAPGFKGTDCFVADAPRNDDPPLTGFSGFTLRTPRNDG